MRSLSFLILLLWLSVVPAHPGALHETDAPERSQVENLFSDQPDLLDVKLSVDQLVEPATDPAFSRATIARMTGNALRMAGENAGSSERLNALRRYLYESGEWNEHRPFTYDLGDPLGENPANSAPMDIRSPGKRLLMGIGVMSMLAPMTPWVDCCVLSMGRSPFGPIPTMLPAIGCRQAIQIWEPGPICMTEPIGFRSSGMRWAFRRTWTTTRWGGS